jgi:hypothetical protein
MLSHLVAHATRPVLNELSGPPARRSSRTVIPPVGRRPCTSLPGETSLDRESPDRSLAEGHPHLSQGETPLDRDSPHPPLAEGQPRRLVPERLGITDFTLSGSSLQNLAKPLKNLCASASLREIPESHPPVLLRNKLAIGRRRINSGERNAESGGTWRWSTTRRSKHGILLRATPNCATSRRIQNFHGIVTRPQDVVVRRSARHKMCQLVNL